MTDTKRDALVALAEEMERDAKWTDGRYVQDAASGGDLDRWASRLRDSGNNKRYGNG